MKASWREHYSQYFGELNLQIGSGADLISEPEWMNHDITPRPGIEVYGKLEWGLHYTKDFVQLSEVNRVVPYVCQETFDCILASHCLEHVEQASLITVISDLWRMLKPGGYLVAITPHGASDDAWENPHHRQLFTPMTWAYFTSALYKQPGHSGTGATEGEPIRPWTNIEVTLVPYPEFISDYVGKPESEWSAEAKFRARHCRNVFQEVHCVMRKEKEEE